LTDAHCVTPAQDLFGRLDKEEALKADISAVLELSSGRAVRAFLALPLQMERVLRPSGEELFALRCWREVLTGALSGPGDARGGRLFACPIVTAAGKRRKQVVGA
jgi:hypothetical protein